MFGSDPTYLIFFGEFLRIDINSLEGHTFFIVSCQSLSQISQPKSLKLSFSLVSVILELITITKEMGVHSFILSFIKKYLQKLLCEKHYSQLWEHGSG